MENHSKFGERENQDANLSIHWYSIILRSVHTYYFILYNTLLNSDRLIGCLWSRDIE